MSTNDLHAELRDFQLARHECLSGHELALLQTPDEHHGARLLARFLVARSVASYDVCAELGSDDAGPDIDAILEKALERYSLDDIVQRLDRAFELELEPQMQMTP